MYTDGKLQIAMADKQPVCMSLQMANRHGLITGVTGTGKTVTLKTIVQSMSDAGVPTFLADVKGDVSGVAVAGEASEKLVERLAGIGIMDYGFHGCPTRFWDVYGEGGLPCRTTISEMGPVLLARLLGLTDVQTGVLNIAFHVADDEGLLLLDLKDLRSIVGYLGEHAGDYTLKYGNVASASVGAIQRALLTLEDAGGDVFFGEPALEISDWLACDSEGNGYINVLDCVRLVQSPLLYSTFLLWMLSELYEMMPEVGDAEKPKACFFFDEAHLLFNDAPKALVEKIEQIVKLVRSKGVGVYFISQSPSDIPGTVLAQLGNKVQHALRAYTPAEQKAIKAAAESFRENPAFDTASAITELATGEALVSFLDEKGTPSMVERAMVIAPACSMDAAPADAKTYIVENDALRAKYGEAVDRESAYEILSANVLTAQQAAEEAKAAEEEAKQRALEEKEAEKQRIAEEKQAEKEAKEAERQRIAEEKAAERERVAAEKKAEKEEKERKKFLDAALTSASRSIGTAAARGLLGVLKKGL